MGYGIKYSTSNVSNTLRKGNVVTTAAHNADPSGNFHAGISIVDGKHNIVKVHSTNDPDFYSLTDEELLNLVNSLGGNVESWLAAKNWINTQSDMFYLNNAVRSNIVTDSLEININGKDNASFVNNKPTTNVLNNDILGTGNGASLGSDAFGDYIQLSYTAQSSYSRFQLPSISVSSDETYTWSFELYATETFTSGFSWDTNEYSDQYPNSNDLSRLSYSASTPSTITAGEWTPFALTVTMKSGLTGAYTYDFFRFYYPTFQGKRIYYRNMQFERTGNGTPYAGQGATRTQNTTWYDLSGNGNNATLVNGVTFDSGSKSLVFDGTDDDGRFSDVFESNDLSVEYLVYPNNSGSTTTDTNRIISRDRSDYWMSGVWKNYAGLEWTVVSDSGMQKRTTTSTFFDVGEWNHVICTYDGSTGDMLAYKNGVLHTTFSNGGVSTNNIGNGSTRIIALGCNVESGGSQGNLLFNGKIAFARVYSKALNSSEVSQNYYDGNIVTDGLVLALDAGNLVSYESGSTTTYSMTGSLSGSLENGVSYSDLNGGNFSFDGTDDQINFGDESSLDFTNGVFSMETWINIPSSWTGGSQYPNLISKGAKAGWDTDGWSLFCFRDYGSGTGYTVGVGLRNSSTTNVRVSYNQPTETWLHVVGTLDGSSIKIYVNGELKTSNTQTINPASNNYNVLLGRDTSGNSFPGEIAISRLYNKTLTPSEVQQNYIAHKARFSS